MKKIVNLIAIVSVLIASCTRDVKTTAENNNNNSNSTTVTGKFVVTKFTDENVSEDKISQFNGYTFLFNADGKIAAERNGVTAQGSYSEKPSYEGEGAKLTINLVMLL